jgi:hypothetical protein
MVEQAHTKTKVEVCDATGAWLYSCDDLIKNRFTQVGFESTLIQKRIVEQLFCKVFKVKGNVQLYVAEVQVAAVLLIHHHDGDIILFEHAFYNGCFR